MAERLGCPFCFRTLSPADTQPALRTFLRCTGCSRRYHEVCWRQGQVCLHCASRIGESISIDLPPDLRVVARRAVVDIKSPVIVNGSSERYRSARPAANWANRPLACWSMPSRVSSKGANPISPGSPEKFSSLFHPPLWSRTPRLYRRPPDAHAFGKLGNREGGSTPVRPHSRPNIFSIADQK